MSPTIIFWVIITMNRMFIFRFYTDSGCSAQLFGYTQFHCAKKKSRRFISDRLSQIYKFYQNYFFTTKVWTTTLCFISWQNLWLTFRLPPRDTELEKRLPLWHWVVNKCNKLHWLSHFFVFLLHILRRPQASSFSSVCIPVKLHLKAQSLLWLLESVLRTPSVCLSVCVE